MATITQIIQNGPAKANQLFAKLAETTDGAVKTREKLLADLKAELELHAQLEEEHLFPVLRRHKETKDLVPDARNDHKQARALLAELEPMPKEGEAFRDKAAELRKVFQQHVRDERKELLPAVRKALSDEETQAVVEKIEADRAEAEEAKRAEAEERRAEARREREEAARQEAEAQALDRRVREAAAAAARSAEASADVARTGVETAQRTAQVGYGLAAQAARQTADQFARLYGASGDRAGPGIEQSARDAEALMQCGTVLARGAQELSREWLSFVQEQSRRNLAGFNAMLRSRTPQDLVAAQGDLVRRSLEDLLSRSVRISERSAEIATEAARTVGGEAGENARGPRRPAA